MSDAPPAPLLTEDQQQEQQAEAPPPPPPPAPEADLDNVFISGLTGMTMLAFGMGAERDARQMLGTHDPAQGNSIGNDLMAMEIGQGVQPMPSPGSPSQGTQPQYTQNSPGMTMNMV